MYRAALVLLLVLLPGTAALAAEPIKIKVGLDVQFDNKAVESEALSFLSRELRSLGDVEMVDSAAEVVIHAAGAGDDRIALSTTVLRVHNELFLRLGIDLALQRGAKKLKRVITDEQWAFMRLVVGSEDLLGQWVNLSTRATLKETCTRLVAQIDSDSLQKQREWRDELRKADEAAFGHSHN